MSVKIARMQSGEDVIADIKEVRADVDAAVPLAYEFVQAYSVVIEQPEQQVTFLAEEGEPEPDQEIDLANVQLRLYPWSPLTIGRNIVTINSVVSISDPHENVRDMYHKTLKKHKPLEMSVYFDEVDENARD